MSLKVKREGLKFKVESLEDTNFKIVLSCDVVNNCNCSSFNHQKVLYKLLQLFTRGRGQVIGSNLIIAKNMCGQALKMAHYHFNTA